MIQYLGVDIIEIHRISAAVDRWGDSFLSRIFTPHELMLYRHKLPSLAARFAAKEAAVKALGCQEFIYHDIEVIADPGQRPEIRLYGRAQSIASHLGITSLAVSLSHSREYATAVVSALV